jgi:hypothetical protein
MSFARTSMQETRWSDVPFTMQKPPAEAGSTASTQHRKSWAASRAVMPTFGASSSVMGSPSWKQRRRLHARSDRPASAQPAQRVFGR